MTHDEVKVGKSYSYATPSSTGTFKVVEVYADANGSAWVLGYDKTKKKDIKVRPGQVHPTSK